MYSRQGALLVKHLVQHVPGNCSKNGKWNSHLLPVPRAVWCGLGRLRPLHRTTIWEAVSKQKTSQQLVEATEKPFGQLTVGQKVKQAGKDATYTGIVIVGVAVTGVMFFAIGRELFSGQSPSGVYSRALKICRKNDELVAALGEPIKGFGETTRRGRRRHVSHLEWEADGIKHMRMKFYLQGAYERGTAQLEVKQSDRGKYEIRYLFVDLEKWPHRTIVIEDNR